MADADGRVRQLDKSLKEEATLVERISDLTARLDSIRNNMTRIEDAILTGIEDLKGRPGGGPS